MNTILRKIYRFYVENFHIIFLLGILNLLAVVVVRQIPYINLMAKEISFLVYALDWIVFIKKYHPSIKQLWLLQLLLLSLIAVMQVLGIRFLTVEIGVFLFFVIITLVVLSGYEISKK